jgi:hypothetical protein
MPALALPRCGPPANPADRDTAAARRIGVDLAAIGAGPVDDQGLARPDLRERVSP